MDNRSRSRADSHAFGYAFGRGSATLDASTR